MSKENIKISKEELEVKKALYRKILDDNYYFFWSLKKRFEKEENQVPKKAFIDMVKTWLSIYKVEFEVKRFQITFGNQDRDGWTFVYDWRTGEHFSRVSTLLDEKEIAEREAKRKAERDKKIAKKLKEFGLGMGLMIGTAVESQHQLIELIQEYDKKGIKEVSIEVLKQIISEASMKTISPEGLLGSMILSMKKEAEQCK